MNDVERALSDLAGRIAYPPTPDLAAPVAGRIASGRRRRRSIALALAVLAAMLAAALAIPGARSALLRWFHLGGVTIERVDQLPVVPKAAPLQLGRRVTLDRAQRRVSFRVRVPSGFEPERVYLDSSPPGGRVSFLYGSPARPRMLITQFEATGARTYAEKIVPQEGSVERVSVAGAPGLWIGGPAHAFYYVDRRGGVDEETLRLAAHTLVWRLSTVTYRLEADVSREEALRIARSVH